MNGRPGVFGIALALLCLGAPAQVQAQCTLTSTPVQFEGTLPNGTKVPSGVPRPILLTAGSSALTVFHNAAGAPRLMNAETFGYSILDLTNPANPTALKYDDFRFDATSSTTNPIPTHGDGQSYIATTAVSKDGQRIAFSMNGPADPPWHTLAGRSDGAEGFGMWGDFPMNRALGTAVQAVAGRYIAYAVSGSANVTAADITSLPTSDFSPLNIPYETSANMPGGYSMLLAGNYLVYTTNAGVLTVVDASNPGPAGRITSAYKSVSIPYLTSDPLLHRAPVNYTAAVDPGDSTKLWLLVEVPKNYPSENSPSYGLVAVTKDGSGNLTATAAPGLIRVPSQAGEIWSNAGNASSLVAQNGFLFVVMWAQRSSPSPQFGFFSTTAYAWPAVSSFTAVSAPNFNLPATSAVSYAGSGNSIYQYFPTGPAAFAIPYSCQPVNVPAVSSLTVTNTSAGTSVSSGDPVFLGDVLTVVPVVGPSPAFNPLTSWSFDFDFHAGNPIEDAVASPRIKNPDNGVFGNPANPPAQAVLTGPCDPTGVPSGDPPTGGSCWTSVLNNGATGGPDFTAAAAAGTTKPLGIAFEARNQYGIANTAVFTVNWVVPAAKIASTHVLSGQPLVSASDGHPLAASYKWYFGNSPTTLAVAPSCTTATCVPTTSPAAGTYYYWLTAAYANGYSTPDYVQGTTAGLPFTITPFIPAFTVNGSATGPVSLQTSQSLTIANSSQRGSGVTGSYSYDLCLSPCTATYSGTTGGVFTGMTDPTNTSGTPPSSATLAAPPTAGTYTLRLRISYAGGTSYWPDPSGVGGVTVTVTNPPPPIVVTAFATPNPANSGDVIQFSCSATGGSGTFSSYQWLDQSGNTFRTTQSFLMSISNAGPGLTVLPVTCSVTDSNGGTGNASFTLTVRPPPPVVTVRATPNPVANGGTVQLACSATGGSGTFTYSWSNGAGTFSSAQSPAITASNPSPTAITSPTTCTVTDTNGSQASATVNLTINGAIPIVVTATVAPGTAYAGDTVQFRCSATGGTGNFVSYSWSTSAGTFATTQSPTMKVANAGNSPIVSVDTCTVTDSMAGVGTGTATLTVNPASGPYSFYVLTPCRVLDTRNAAGALGGPSLQAAGAPDRSFPVLTSACGIPANAKSLSVNVTVTNVTAAGDLSFYRGDGQETGTSTASLMVGRTRANNAMVQLALDGSGTIAVQNTSAGTVDVIVDVNGYFR